MIFSTGNMLVITLFFQALQQALLQQQVALGLKADNKNQSPSLQNQVINRKCNRKWDRK